MNIRIILVTNPSFQVAQNLAMQMVQERLAACVSIAPGIRSVYWWNDNVNVDQEVLLLIKSTTELLEQLQSFLTEHHPYDTPEFVALAPSEVSEKYAVWLMGEVKQESD